ncbi:MAG: iron-sulfur cluster insertion protein ErpA [Candidatus Dasytiphilus stammeri]
MITYELPEINLTKSAHTKISILLLQSDNPNIKFRIYITGGGCNGFKYKFILDDKIILNDIIIKKNNNVCLIIDDISIQYLQGSKIDYIQQLKGSRFIVINPNAKITCSCGSSFTT